MISKNAEKTINLLKREVDKSKSKVGLMYQGKEEMDLSYIEGVKKFKELVDKTIEKIKEMDKEK